MKTKKSTRLLSLLLSFCMMFGMLPSISVKAEAAGGVKTAVISAYATGETSDLRKSQLLTVTVDGYTEEQLSELYYLWYLNGEPTDGKNAIVCSYPSVADAGNGNSSTEISAKSSKEATSLEDVVGSTSKLTGGGKSSGGLNYRYGFVGDSSDYPSNSVKLTVSVFNKNPLTDSTAKKIAEGNVNSFEDTDLAKDMKTLPIFYRKTAGAVDTKTPKEIMAGNGLAHVGCSSSAVGMNSLVEYKNVLVTSEDQDMSIPLSEAGYAVVSIYCSKAPKCYAHGGSTTTANLNIFVLDDPIPDLSDAAGCDSITIPRPNKYCNCSYYAVDANGNRFDWDADAQKITGLTPGTAYTVYEHLKMDTLGVDTDVAMDTKTVTTKTHTWKYENPENRKDVVRAYCTNNCACEYDGADHAVTLTVTADDRVYTGAPYDGASSENKITPVTKKEVGLMQYFKVNEEGGSLDQLGGSPTNAGTYIASRTIHLGGTMYVSAQKLFHITRKPIKPDNTDGYSKVYNGQPQTADVDVTDKPYKVEQNNGGTNVNTYPVILKLTDPDNYVWENAADPDDPLTEIPFKIVPASNKWMEEPSMNGWTYGTTPSTPDKGDPKFCDEDKNEPIVTYKSKDGAEDYGTTPPTDAGEYIAVFTVPATDNYAGLTFKEPFTITKADNDIAPSVDDCTYGEKPTVNPGTPIFGQPEDVQVTYKGTTNAGEPYGPSPEKPTEAGDYTATFVVPGTENTNPVTKTDDFKIKKQEVPVPDAGRKTYTGTVLKSDLTDTDKYTVTKNNGGIPVNANDNDYPVSVALKDCNNYKWAGDNTETVVTKVLNFYIDPAVNEWTTTPSINNGVAGQTPVQPQAASKFGTPTITYVGIGNTNYPESATPPVAVGTYMAKFHVPETKNYTNKLNKEIPFTIEAPQYSINVVPSPNGTTTASDSVAKPGKPITITPNPNADSLLKDIAVTDPNGKPVPVTKQPDGTYTFTMPDSPVTVTTEYEKKPIPEYPVDVVPPLNGSTSASDSIAKPGKPVVIRPNPDEDAVLKDVVVTDSNGNQVPVTKQEDNTYTFIMPDGPVTIKTEYVKIPKPGKPTGADDTGVSDFLITDQHPHYINGYPDHSVRPNGNITRAETAMIFYNLLKNKDVAITKSFTDIPEGKWYTAAVNTLASMDVISGYSDGTFRPNAAITRAEFTAIGMRFAKYAQGDVTFVDVPETHWAYPYISSAATYRWISGYTDGTFKPAAKIKRCEVAVIINNMLNREADRTYVTSHFDEMIQFTDLQDDKQWYFFQMIEATNEHDFVVDHDTEIWTKVTNP